MTRRTGKFNSRAKRMLSTALAVMLLTPVVVAAKDEDGRERLRFYGWVEVMPAGLHGTWVIGGQQMTTTPQTQFDQADGPLRVGGCAKVEIRAGAVHEIDSEPDRDCR